MKEYMADFKSDYCGGKLKDVFGLFLTLIYIHK